MMQQTQDDLQHVFSNLREYIRSLDISGYLDSANEAKTRLLVIDRVLEALGWSQLDFHPEETVGDVGFTDYLLKIDDVPRLIVEAKKIGVTFAGSRANLKKITYKLSFLRTQYGTNISEVLDQAETYSTKKGVPYALITNGIEWFAAQFSHIPSIKSIDDLDAFYFGNILNDDFRIELFWNLVSKLAVTEGSLEEYFSQHNTPEATYIQIPQTQLPTIQWKQPEENLHLSECYDYFFTDITDPARNQMLMRCYVTNTRLDQYEGELKRTLKDIAPSYLSDAIEIQPDTEAEFLHNQTGDKRGQVILITGSVGCGKSTFASKVLFEERSKHKGKQHKYIKLDLIDELVNQSDDIPARLWGLLFKHWIDEHPETVQYDELVKIFGNNLLLLKTGAKARLFENDEKEYIRAEAELLDSLVSDPENYMLATLRYYSHQMRHGIVIFLDNVDRQYEEYQRQVYSFAHKLTSDTGVTAIITMRESTFFRGQQGGFLDVRASDIVYHLQTPNLEQIISRRIKYIENYMDDDPRVSKWRRSRDWDTFKNEILHHTKKIKSVFLVDKSGREKLSLLAAISWHNVRYFLRILKSIHIDLGSDTSTWSISEIIASLMIPTAKSINQFIIPNVFKPSFANYNCYFLKLRLLLLLVYGVKAHEVVQGISVNRIMKFSLLYGYQRSWIERTLEELVQTRLIECLETPIEQEFTQTYRLDRSHSFRPSPLASVLFQYVLSQPLYLSLIGNELPFHSSVAHDKYLKAIQSLLDTLDNNLLEKVAIELIANDSSLAQITAQYLLNSLEYEKPSSSILRYTPEVSATEKKLDEIMKHIQDIAGDISVEQDNFDTLNITTLPLFEDLPINDDLTKSNILPILLPDNFLNFSIGRSKLAPIIFCAMATLHLNDKSPVTKNQITEVINDVLLDDSSKKSNSSITQALNSATLKSQEWFHAKSNGYYELMPDWEKHWVEIFGINPKLRDM